MLKDFLTALHNQASLGLTCNVIKMLESDKDKSGTWGGQRPGAGNKFKWNSGETKAVRIPIAIADEVLEAAKAIDAGKHLVADDCVTHSSATRADDEARYLNTLAALEAANHKLSKEVGELKADLFRLHQQLRQVTKERDDYFDRISDIQLELDNLKDDSVTQSSPDDGETEALKERISDLEGECSRKSDLLEHLRQKLEESQQLERTSRHQAQDLRLELKATKTKLHECQAIASQPLHSEVGNTADASTLFNQLRPLLSRLNDRERRAVQQKLEAILETDSQPS